MSAVSVTIKLEPAEYDLVRAAVLQFGLMAKADTDNQELTAAQRHERRQVAVQATDLAKKLGA